MTTTYLDIDELATILGKSTRTIKRNLLQNPTTVPPQMHIPGTAMLRWQAHKGEELAI